MELIKSIFPYASPEILTAAARMRVKKLLQLLLSVSS